MNAVPTLYIVAMCILMLNVPFGYWRGGLRKLSPVWFLSIHLPVPMAIGLRWVFGLHFRLATLPLFVSAFFLGQFLGGRLRLFRIRWMRKNGKPLLDRKDQIDTPVDP